MELSDAMDIVPKDSRYRIVARHHELQSVITKHPAYGRQVWFRGRVTYRKVNESCVLCGRAVSNPAYHPLTNGVNRGDRMCVQCAEETEIKRG